MSVFTAQRALEGRVVSVELPLESRAQSTTHQVEQEHGFDRVEEGCDEHEGAECPQYVKTRPVKSGPMSRQQNASAHAKATVWEAALADAKLPAEVREHRRLAALSHSPTTLVPRGVPLPPRVLFKAELDQLALQNPRAAEEVLEMIASGALKPKEAVGFMTPRGIPKLRRLAKARMVVWELPEAPLDLPLVCGPPPLPPSVEPVAPPNAAKRRALAYAEKKSAETLEDATLAASPMVVTVGGRPVSLDEALRAAPRVPTPGVEYGPARGSRFEIRRDRFFSELDRLDREERVARQGNAWSRPVRVQREGNLPPGGVAERVGAAADAHAAAAGGIANFINGLRNIGETLGENTEFLLHPEMMGLVTLANARTEIELAGALHVVWCHPKIQSTIPRGIFWTLYGILVGKALFTTECTSGVRREVHTATAINSNWIAIFQHSPLVKKAGLLLGAMGCSFFIGNFPLAIQVMLKNMSHGVESFNATVTVAETAWDFVEYFFKRVYAASVSGNPLDLLGRDLELELIDEMSQYQIDLAQFRLNPKGKTPKEMEDVGRALIKRSSAFVDTRNVMHIALRTSVFGQVQAFVLAQMTERKAPVGLICVGDSGAGKTAFATEVSNLIKLRLEVPQDVNITMQVLAGVSHQQTPVLPLFLVYNDAFQIKDEALRDSVINDLQATVDTTVYRFETASLAEKANSAVAPEVVMWTTNTWSYVASQMTCGADKLNRRYTIVHFKFTEKAKKLAKRGRFPLGDIYKHHPAEDGLVTYTYGRADFGPLNVLDFSKILHPRETGDMGELLNHVNDMLEERKESKPLAPSYTLSGGRVVRAERQPEGAASSGPASLGELEEEEEWAVPRKNHYHVATLDGQTICAMGLDVGTAIETEQLVDEDGSYQWKPPPHNCFFAVTPGIPAVRYKLKNIPGGVRVVSRHIGYHHVDDRTAYVRYMEERVDKAWVEHFGTSYQSNMLGEKFTINGKQYPKWLLGLFGATLLAGLPALLAIVYQMRQFVPEATLFSGLTNVPAEKARVNPTKTHEMLWAGGSTGHVVGKISSPDGYSMNYVVMGPNTIVTASHFFNGWKDQDNNIRKMEPGARFTLTLGGKTLQCLFDPHSLVVKGDDLAYYRTVGMDTVVCAAYHLLPSKIFSGRGTATFKGQEVSIHDDRTTASSSSGDCGLPYYVGEALVGIHVGATLELGYRHTVLERLSQEQFVEVQKEFSRRLLPVVLLSNSLPEGAATYLENLRPGLHPQSGAAYVPERMESTGHYALGHLPFASQPQMTGVASPVREWFPEMPDYAAPHTRAKKENGYAGPLLKRLTLMEQPVSPRLDVLQRTFDHLYSKLPPAQVRFEPLTLHQALCGDDRSHFMRPRDLTKSCGFALREFYGVTNKNAFTLQPDGRYEVHPAVLSEHARLLGELKAGRVPPTFATATQKDEMYPKEKSEAGKARLFFVVDATLNILLRQYILPLMSHMLDHPMETGFMLSINPGSPKWGELAKCLTQFGDGLVSDADQTGFDILHKLMIDFVAMYVYKANMFYGMSEEDAQVSYRLVHMCFRQALWFEGNLYVVGSSLLSGVAITAWINCLINQAITLYCYFRTGGNTPEQHFYQAVAGDDAVATFHPESPLQPKDIPVLAAELGYQVTDGQKASVPTLRHLSLVTFLKRHFRVVGPRVFSPLEIESILKAICYQLGKKVDPLARLAAAVGSAHRELFMHPPEVRDRFLPRFEEVRQLAGAPPFPTWQQLQDEWDCGVYEPWGIAPRGGVGSEEGLALPALGRISRQGDHQTNELTTLAPEATTAVGTAMVDVQVAMAESQGVGSAVKTGTMEFEQSGFESIFGRPRLTSHFSVALSAPVNLGAYPNGPQMAGILRHYQGWKPNLRVTLTFAGTSAVQGRGRVYFLPIASLVGSGMTKELSRVPFLYDAVPHIDLDFSQPCTCTIDLPYLSNRAWIPVDVIPWVASFVVLSPLASVYGLTPPLVECKAYVSSHSVELFVPVKREGILREGEGDMVPKGPLQLLAGYAKRVVAGSPFPYAGPISRALGFVEGVAEDCGYTRPPAVPTMAVVAYTNPQVALTSGQPDFAPVMAMNTAVGRNVDPKLYGGQVGVGTVQELSQQWTLLGLSGAWGSAHYVTPTVSVAQTVDSYALTSMGHVALMYQDWRGSIEVRVTFVSSPLVRYRAGINVYPKDGVVPTAFDGSGVLISHVVDVIGTTQFTFVVPWVSPRLWLPVDAPHTRGDATPSQPLAFKIWVVDGPYGPSATPVAGDFLLEVRGGPDIEFVNPGMVHLESYRVVREGLAASVVGEATQSCLELSKRASELYVRPTTATAFTLPAHGELSTTADLKVIWVHDTWMRMAHLGFTGGSTWTLMMDAPGVTQTEQFEAGRAVTTGSGGAVLSQNLSVLQARSIDRCPLLYTKVGATPDGASGQVLYVLSTVKTNSLWLAASDDRNYVFYLGPAVVQKVVIPP